MYIYIYIYIYSRRIYHIHYTIPLPVAALIPTLLEPPARALPPCGAEKRGAIALPPATRAAGSPLSLYLSLALSPATPRHAAPSGATRRDATPRGAMQWKA